MSGEPPYFSFMDTKLNHSPQFKQGYLYAVRLLTASKKSEREVAKRLSEKGYLSEVIEEVIAQLKKQKILSDQKLAQETVHTTLLGKRYGPKRIYYQLRKRGIPEHEAHEAAEAYPKSLERETAKELASERWLKLKNIEPKKRKKRLYDFLINRGFNHELAFEIVKQIETKKDEDF
jgi:regulatory protein